MIDRERTIRWDDPHAKAAELRALAGIDALRAIVKGDFPPPPIALALGFTLAEVEDGRVVFTCVPAEYHYNPIGSVHGGLAATLLDSAMGCAIHTKLPAGAGYATTDLQIRYIRGIGITTGPIAATGTVVHVGRQIAVAEGRIVDGNGRLLATGTTGCAILTA